MQESLKLDPDSHSSTTPERPDASAIPIVEDTSVSAVEILEDRHRRSFLKKFGIATMGGVVGFSAQKTAFPFRSGLKSDEERRRIYENLENVAHIETPNAHYNIVYSVHSQITNPRVVDGVDVVALESVADFSDDTEVLVDLHDIRRDRRHQYTNVVNKALTIGTPLFYVDATPAWIGEREKDDLRNARLATFSRTSLETATGGALLASGLTDRLKPEGTSTRRSFFGIMRKFGKLIAGGYLASHLPEQIAHNTEIYSTQHELPDVQSTSHGIRKEMTDINSRIHPEINTDALETRNTLVAEKVESLARYLRKELGRKPTIALIIGAFHTGIEQELLRDPQDRIQDLKGKLGEKFESQGKIWGAVSQGGSLKVKCLVDPSFKQQKTN